MLFNSVDFLVFFPIVTMVYFLLPHKVRWLIYFAGVFAIVIFGIYGPGYAESQFIYFQF